MRTRKVGLLFVALLVLAGSVTAARTVGRRAVGHFERAEIRGGADSARIASFLSSLGRGDPLVCVMVADQIGNFWTDEGQDVVGRFADASPALASAKDSLHERITDAAAVRLLVAQLGDPNSCVRRAAARLLQRSAIETSRLADLLTHSSPLVREAAAYALSDDDRRAARGALERTVRAGQAPEAAMAAWALGEQGELAALDVLVAALDAGDARTRYAAAHAIGELHDVEHAPAALVRAARSPDQTLRRYAGHSLAEIHDPATVDALIELMTSADRPLRVSVIEALGNIGSAKAIPVLTAATRDPSVEVRRAAVEALGEVARER